MEPVPQPPKVLVVEDDPVCAEVLHGILAAGGYATVHAPDGQPALAYLQATPFDLLLTDIIMPERDGFELIQQVRREFPPLGIIAFSGLDPFQVDVLKMARLLGADAALRKPCDPKLLLEIIAAVLRRRPRRVD